MRPPSIFLKIQLKSFYLMKILNIFDHFFSFPFFFQEFLGLQGHAVRRFCAPGFFLVSAASRPFIIKFTSILRVTAQFTVTEIKDFPAKTVSCTSKTSKL